MKSSIDLHRRPTEHLTTQHPSYDEYVPSSPPPSFGEGMPTIRLQYDLRATHVDNNVPGVSHGRVYNLIRQGLTARNWNRHQSSKWYKTTHTTFLTASGEVQAVCQAFEALCGFGTKEPPLSGNIQQQVNKGHSDTALAISCVSSYR